MPRDSTNTGSREGHAFGRPAAFGQPRGAQDVHGVLKRGEQKNKYAQNKPEERRYVWLDLATMATESHSEPLLIVAAARPGERPPAVEWSYTYLSRTFSPRCLWYLRGALTCYQASSRRRQSGL